MITAYNIIATLGVLLIAIFSIGIHISPWRKNIEPYAELLAGIVAIIATIGSLIYSEIIGFLPCVLCWYQRIFLYPLAFILPYAYKRKESLYRYGLLLTGVGSLFSIYHTWIYYQGVDSVFCETGISCTQQFVIVFGFMTIPLMSLLSFASIISLLLLKTRRA